MEHYLKPALAKDPQGVILHVGTNDLKSNLRPNPNQIADIIVDLARMTESESRAEVIISEVITRSDKTPEDHIRIVNKLLSRCCNQNGWQLLRHNHISKDHLNDGGLHLNDQGVSVLVTNLARILSDLYCIRSPSEPPSAHVPGAHSEFVQYQSPYPSTNDAAAIESNNFNSDSYTFLPSRRGLKMT